MRNNILLAGVALALGLALAPTGSAVVDGDRTALSLDENLSLGDSLDLLVPAPVRDVGGSPLEASLPGDDGALTPDPALLGQAPAVPQATAAAPALLDDASHLDAGHPSATDAEPDRARGAIEVPGTSGDRAAPLPAYVLGDASTVDASEDGSSGADARTQAAASSSPSSAADAWQSLDDGEKAAVAAGALGLLALGPLSLYSRIKRDDALENDTRRAVYEIVETNPGVCIQDVADEADVSYSTASYHLKRLVRMDYVTRKENGNKVLYYKNGGTFTGRERELIPVLQNEEAMRVFRHIVENPWCYRAQVAEALDVSHTTVNWHLDNLQGADLVEEHREGRSCHLHVEEETLERVTAVMDKLEAEGAGEVAPRARAAAA